MKNKTEIDLFDLRTLTDLAEKQIKNCYDGIMYKIINDIHEEEQFSLPGVGTIKLNVSNGVVYGVKEVILDPFVLENVYKLHLVDKELADMSEVPIIAHLMEKTSKEFTDVVKEAEGTF